MVFAKARTNYPSHQNRIDPKFTAENKLDDIMELSSSASIINHLLINDTKLLVLITVFKLECRWRYNTVLFKIEF